MFDQSLRCDLDTAKPFDAEPFEAALKISMNGIGPRKTNECFLDFVPFPQLFRMRQLGFLLNQQNQRELEQRPHLNSRARFFVNQHDPKIDFASQE